MPLSRTASKAFTRPKPCVGRRLGRLSRKAGLRYIGAIDRRYFVCSVLNKALDLIAAKQRLVGQDQPCYPGNDGRSERSPVEADCIVQLRLRAPQSCRADRGAVIVAVLTRKVGRCGAQRATSGRGQHIHAASVSSPRDAILILLKR